MAMDQAVNSFAPVNHSLAPRCAFKNIVVFNIKYSSNLGDGLTAMSIEKAIQDECPEANVTTIDLAGRQKFGDDGIRGRGILLRVFGLMRRLPAPMRDRLQKFALHQVIAKNLQSWRDHVASADLVVIGGGQLFQDTNLNFPMKLSAMANICLAENKRVAIYGVGVAPHWSKAAAELFEIFARLRIVFIAVRDEASRLSWQRHFAGHTGWRVNVCRDPGLLAADILPQPPKMPGTAAKIALCVTNPRLLALHANADVVGSDGMGKFYKETVFELISQGMHVALFTNGAGEDEAYLTAICRDPRFLPLLNSGVLIRRQRPLTPEDLVRLVSQADIVIAHRLHACIAAFAFAIPSIGLGWDQKLNAFFNSVGRDDYILTARSTTPAQLTNLVHRALVDGIDSNVHERVIDQARQGITDLFVRLAWDESGYPPAEKQRLGEASTVFG
jgi:polysaccharide pyruvyl transferase WcaK-like protein